ncbi:outer membrane lipoprotein-sorting protein [bacterium]|nr:outer membrane lipoprotein-sorting protein [bacterium]
MRRPMLLVLPLLVLTALPAHAADSPTALLQRMKRWLEPAQPSTRQLAMSVRTGAEVAQWTAGQARGSVDGRNYALTVLLAPADLRGTALLVQEQPNGPDREWLYLPYLRRVREVLPVDEFESFLNTEFTYADVGFVEIGNRDVSSGGSDTVDGVAAVKVQEVPKDKRTFARIVTWVVPETGQPLKREYYDVANRLWKTETFEHVADIHGIPTAQRVRIEDVQTGYGSEYRTAEIAYGIPIPPELFDPAQLAKAADSPLWK